MGTKELTSAIQQNIIILFTLASSMYIKIYNHFSIKCSHQTSYFFTKWHALIARTYTLYWPKRKI